MDAEALAREQFVIVRVHETCCAVSALHVKTMAEIPTVVAVPLAPKYVRGMVEMLGTIYSLIDLRTLLGFAPLSEELDDMLAMLKARETDHVNWLNELKSSVEERREFTLQLDPHKCAFGKWYYTYTPPAQWVTVTLRKFEEPHNTIHRLATRVKSLQAEGRTDEAMALLNSAEDTELALLKQLFSVLGKQVAGAMKEICLVLEVGRQTASFSVDAVESIERFSADSFQELDGTPDEHNDLVSCLARRATDDSVVTVLNTHALVALMNPAHVDTA